MLLYIEVKAWKTLYTPLIFLMLPYTVIFNGTICLPQIAAAACGGLVLKLVGGAQVSMFLVAGVLLVLGALSVRFVKEGKNA